MASRVACVTAVVALAAATAVVDGRRVTPLAESEPFPSSLPQSEPGSFSAASHDRWSSGNSDLPSGERFPSSLPTSEPASSQGGEGWVSSDRNPSHGSERSSERFPSSLPQSEPTSSAGHWHFSSDVPSGERFPSSLPQSEPTSSQGGEGWSSGRWNPSRQSERSSERFPSSLPTSEPASSQGGEGWSSGRWNPHHGSTERSSERFPSSLPQSEPHESMPEFPSGESWSGAGRNRGAAKEWALGMTKKQAVLAGGALAVFIGVAVAVAIAALTVCCCCKKTAPHQDEEEAAGEPTKESPEPFPSVEKGEKNSSPVNGQEHFEPEHVVLGSLVTVVPTEPAAEEPAKEKEVYMV